MHKYKNTKIHEYTDTHEERDEYPNARTHETQIH